MNVVLSSRISPGEKFVPTFEVTLWERDYQGKPLKRKRTYRRYTAAGLAAAYNKHRKLNPLPRQQNKP